MDAGFLPRRPLTGCVCTAVAVVLVVIVVVVVVVVVVVIDDDDDDDDGIEEEIDDDGGGIDMSFIGFAAVGIIGTEEGGG